MDLHRVHSSTISQQSIKYKIMFKFFSKKAQAFKSNEYWETRYQGGGNSGSGSYNHLAEFKADIINRITTEEQLSGIIEFGCGDGNQLALLNIPRYIGLDVSPTIIKTCKNKFKADLSKSFFLYNHECFVDNYGVFKCDASMSIDVLFHLVEQQVYETYLEHLFASASAMVIIYAANQDIPQRTSHELFRKFTIDVERKFPRWHLREVIKNKYPSRDYDDENGSLAEFFIYVPVK